MDDLVKWLGEQLDAQEARVRALPSGPWVWGKEDEPAADVLEGPDETVLSSGDAESYSSWIYRHDAFDAYLPDIDPARVLREVEAKRELLKEHKPDGWDCSTCAAPETYDDDADGNREWSRDGKSFPCPTLRLLASVYSDRPGYREEWRP